MVVSGCQDRFFGSPGEKGIDMQKQQYVSARGAGAGIHLHTPAPRRTHQQIAHARRKLRRAVRAAAVRHDHLVPASAQRRERLERVADPRRLVQRGDDDRKSLSDQS